MAESLREQQPRPHYATHIFKDEKRKYGRHYLYWGRCWCGYKAEAFGKQLVECKLHGHSETMSLIIERVKGIENPHYNPTKRERRIHLFDPTKYDIFNQAIQAMIKKLEE